MNITATSEIAVIKTVVTELTVRPRPARSPGCWDLGPQVDDTVTSPRFPGDTCAVVERTVGRGLALTVAGVFAVGVVGWRVRTHRAWHRAAWPPDAER
jgi:hypothetical protein